MLPDVTKGRPPRTALLPEPDPALARPLPITPNSESSMKKTIVRLAALYALRYFTMKVTGRRPLR